MDSPATGPQSSSLSSVVADQACNVCRQRKGRCDRVLPRCSPCARFDRHCLYQKQVRTPLTRKHMNALELRVERAEGLLRQAQAHTASEADRTVAAIVEQPAMLREKVSGASDVSNDASDFAAVEIVNSTLERPPQELVPGSARAAAVGLMERSFTGRDDDFSGVQPLQDHLTPLDIRPSVEETNGLDNSYDVLGDFEWDESSARSPTIAPPGHPRDGSSSEPPDEAELIGDGMATLAVDESQGAYFGVASGAALLRAIDPDAAQSPRPRSASKIGGSGGRSSSELPMQLSSRRLVTDTLIDAYFRYYHISYPIIHEPTFRAQYDEVVERPNGPCWRFLAHIVAAIGAFTTCSDKATDNALFAEVKLLMNATFMENGNLTLVQALVLMSNYLQKKNMPNSGYNYMGLATRMAMGIGLHKEFSRSKSSSTPPFKMEMRRRVWWCMTVFDIGAEVTFGRPVLLPAGGFEVALPMNIHDWQLTARATDYPVESPEITLYSSIRLYASFYLAVVPVYARMESRPYPSAEDLTSLDDKIIIPWFSSIPAYFDECAEIPQKHRLSHSVLLWKYRHFKTLMYRPFVVKDMLRSQRGGSPGLAHSTLAQQRCLHEAQASIVAIGDFWNNNERTRLGAWYALYFLFQAALILCLCLRSQRDSESAGEWREQINSALSVMDSLGRWTHASKTCHEILERLCEGHLRENLNASNETMLRTNSYMLQMDEDPSVAWPDVYPLEEFNDGMIMQADFWTDLLPEGM